MRPTCEYGKKIKHALVDKDKTQRWLIEKVVMKTGLSFDTGYLGKILRGESHPEKICKAINSILGIEG